MATRRCSSHLCNRKRRVTSLSVECRVRWEEIPTHSRGGWPSSITGTDRRGWGGATRVSPSRLYHVFPAPRVLSQAGHPVIDHGGVSLSSLTSSLWILQNSLFVKTPASISAKHDTIWEKGDNHQTLSGCSGGRTEGARMPRSRSRRGPGNKGDAQQ